VAQWFIATLLRFSATMSRSVCDDVVLVAQRAIVTLLRWLDALLNGRVIGVSATTTDASATLWVRWRSGSSGRVFSGARICGRVSVARVN